MLCQIHNSVKIANSLPVGHLVGMSTIPTTTDEQWQYVVQDHDAKRAHRHFDVRLASPNINRGYSWAGRYFPEDVGEIRLFHRQPDHNVRYFDFSGMLGHGYGEGKVDIAQRGTVVVHKSDPGKVVFSYADKTYALINTNGKKWLLMRTK